MAHARKKFGYIEFGAALVFLTMYVLIANAMEGLNFDTWFIALFCTFLSTFVVRCAIGFFTGR